MAADHTLTVLEVGTMFGSSRPQDYAMAGVANGTCQLVDDPFATPQVNRGTVMKCDMFEGFWGHGRNDADDYKPMGIQADVHWNNGAGHSDSNFTEVYYSVDIAFPLNFIFPASIHCWSMKNDYKASYAELPRNLDPSGYPYRLFTCNLGQVNSDNGGAASNLTYKRVPANGDHCMGNYYYNYEEVQRTKLFSDSPTTAPTNAAYPGLVYTQHVRGTWANIQSHYKLNTQYGANCNGILESWFNGVKVVDIQDFPWRDDGTDTPTDFSSYNFDKSTFGNWVGGSGDLFAAAQDQSMYFDNLIVSTEKIG